MKSLDELEQNLHLLLTRYGQQEAQISQLEHENQQLRDEMLRTHAELHTLKQQYNNLQTAHSLLSQSEETRTRAYQQLTYMITEVDNAIEVLKQ